jgi:hypothetical protein
MNNPTYFIFGLLDVVYYLCSLGSLNKHSWYTCLESEQVSDEFHFTRIHENLVPKPGKENFGVITTRASKTTGPLTLSLPN